MVISLVSHTPHGGHREFVGAVGFDIDALRHARIWILPVGTLTQASAQLPSHQALMVVAGLGALEYLAGSIVALSVFFLCDALVTVASTLLLWTAATLGADAAQRMIEAPQVGSSAAAIAAWSAAAVLAPARWRLVGVGLLALYLCVTTPFFSADVALPHALAAVCGIPAGWVIARAGVGHPAAGAAPLP